MCSGGSDCSACISVTGTKEEKNSFGNSANSRAIPPVSPRLTVSALILFFNSSGFYTISLMVSAANKGMQNSAITRMEETARNLLYIGT